MQLQLLLKPNMPADLTLQLLHQVLIGASRVFAFYPRRGLACTDTSAVGFAAEHLVEVAVSLVHVERRPVALSIRVKHARTDRPLVAWLRLLHLFRLFGAWVDLDLSLRCFKLLYFAGLVFHCRASLLQILTQQIHHRAHIVNKHEVSKSKESLLFLLSNKAIVSCELIFGEHTLLSTVLIN